MLYWSYGFDVFIMRLSLEKATDIGRGGDGESVKYYFVSNKLKRDVIRAESMPLYGREYRRVSVACEMSILYSPSSRYCSRVMFRVMSRVVYWGAMNLLAHKVFLIALTTENIGGIQSCRSYQLIEPVSITKNVFQQDNYFSSTLYFILYEVHSNINLDSIFLIRVSFAWFYDFFILLNDYIIVLSFLLWKKLQYSKYVISYRVADWKEKRWCQRHTMKLFSNFSHSN